MKTKVKSPLIVKIAQLLLAGFIGFAVAEITPPSTDTASITKIVLVSGIIVIMAIGILTLHTRKAWGHLYSGVVLCLYSVLSFVGMFMTTRHYPGILSTSLKGAFILGILVWGSILAIGLALLLSKDIRLHFHGSG